MPRWEWGALVLAGCWKVDRAVIEAGAVDFSPSGVTVQGWTVRESPIDLECPDGRPARLVLVHPVRPDGPVPTALLFHSGSFDFVQDPTPGSPLEGEHFARPDRLEMPWAVRQAYATLGMFPTQTVGEVHDGSLPAALVDAGVAVIVPTNCWGDWWHNASGASDNDFEADLFFRNGRSLADFAWQLAEDPSFGPNVGAELSFEPDPDALYAIGLGEGGRAVGELLHLGHVPRAVAVDSLLEDLSTAQPATIEGLMRVFPDGDLARGAVNSAPELPPTAWIHSPIDPVLPAGSQDLVLARLAQSDVHLRIDGTTATHVLSNRDPELADQVVDFLLDAP